MTYLPFAILLVIALITLTVVSERGLLSVRLSRNVNLVLTIAGGSIFAVVEVIAHRAIHADGLEANFISWAEDMFSIYHQITLPVFGVLFGILLLTTILAWFDNKSRPSARYLRAAFSLSASIVMLLIAPFYGFMTENTTVPLEAYILWLGVAQALLFRLPLALDAIVRTHRCVKSK